ncbi:MAG: hypothetical protein HF309_18130 [Ignavibacteria bacterium]|jgi:hypothetical protein|nr:hypothetical protein [Ignavibacteria bacterium]MCU7518541.1 hypothetical protein [Ignavibacteria bacterium]
MSWYFKAVGKKAAVKKKVEEDAQLPQSVKNVITDHIQEDDGGYNGISVEGSGHKYTGPGSYYNSIAKLEIQQFEILE